MCVRVFYFLQEVIYSGASLSLLFFSQSLGGREGQWEGMATWSSKKVPVFLFFN